jgi:co-chaperonin GroES (HSP10)
MKKLKAVGHHILVKVSTKKKNEIKDKVSTGGIVLETVDDQVANLHRDNLAATSGEVIDIGPTAFEDMPGDPWCKVGDKIKFVRYSGVHEEIEGELFRLMNDEDCKGLIIEK